jgi:hypothetical protein
MTAEEIQEIIAGTKQELELATRRAVDLKRMLGNLQHMEGTPDDVVAPLKIESEFADANVARLNESIGRLSDFQNVYKENQAKIAAVKAEAARRWNGHFYVRKVRRHPLRDCGEGTTRS